MSLKVLEAQKLMSMISMIFGLAPAMAPVVGAWIVTWGGWHALFWALAAFRGHALLALCSFVLPETHPRERRIGLSPRSLFTSYREILASSQFLPLTLGITCNFAGLFVYIAGAPAFVLGILKLRQDQFYWLFVPVISGLVLGAMLAGRLAGRVSARKVLGAPAPQIMPAVAAIAGPVRLALAGSALARAVGRAAVSVCRDRRESGFTDTEPVRARPVSATPWRRVIGDFARIHHAHIQCVACGAAGAMRLVDSAMHLAVGFALCLSRADLHCIAPGDQRFIAKRAPPAGSVERDLFTEA